MRKMLQTSFYKYMARPIDQCTFHNTQYMFERLRQQGRPKVEILDFRLERQKKTNFIAKTIEKTMHFNRYTMEMKSDVIDIFARTWHQR